MIQRIRNNSQIEYSRVLDENHARKNGLSQTECAQILIESGISFEQAKNGAYVYLHHNDNLRVKFRATQDWYNEILDDIVASTKRPIDCIRILEQIGCSYGQAKSAVYKYRLQRGLIKS